MAPPIKTANQWARMSRAERTAHLKLVLADEAQYSGDPLLDGPAVTMHGRVIY